MGSSLVDVVVVHNRAVIADHSLAEMAGHIPVVGEGHRRVVESSEVGDMIADRIAERVKHHTASLAAGLVMRLHPCYRRMNQWPL